MSKKNVRMINHLLSLLLPISCSFKAWSLLGKSAKHEPPSGHEVVYKFIQNRFEKEF